MSQKWLALIHELPAFQGAHLSGEFDASFVSSLAFVARHVEGLFGRSFALEATARPGVGKADYPAGRMFEADGAICLGVSVSLVGIGEGTIRLTVA